MKNKFKILMGLKIVAGITIVFLLCGYGTMMLWNWLVPALFNGPVIIFWQAIGLLALSKILFGGIRFRGKGNCDNKREWKYKMEWRMKNMTPEEKEKFKNRCGGKWWNSEETEKSDASA